jgi:hypothetical protein
VTSTERITNTTRDEATGLAEHAGGATQDVATNASSAVSDVAGTAKEQVSAVASTARDEVRDLRGQAGGQLRAEAEQQARRLSQNLRQMSEQLTEMAGQSGSEGVARDLVRQAAHHSSRAADFIESRGPTGMVDEVQRFARRRPGLFLLTAAAAGVAVGRMTRAAKSAGSAGSAQSAESVRSTSGSYSSYGSYRPSDTAELQPETITLPEATGTMGAPYGRPTPAPDEAGGAW